MKKLNSLGTQMGKKVSKKPMSFQILIITQNELTCVHSLFMIEDILLVEKAANTTIVRVSLPYRKLTGNAPVMERKLSEISVILRKPGIKII